MTRKGKPEQSEEKLKKSEKPNEKKDTSKGDTGRKYRIGSWEECPEYLKETSHLKVGYRIGFNKVSLVLKRYQSF